LCNNYIIYNEYNKDNKKITSTYRKCDIFFYEITVSRFIVCR